MLNIAMSIAIAASPASPCQCKAIFPWRDHLKSWMMHQKTYMMKSNAKHFGIMKASKKGRGRVA